MQDSLVTRSTRVATAIATHFTRKARNIASSSRIRPSIAVRAQNFEQQVRYKLAHKEQKAGSTQLLETPVAGATIIKAARKNLFCSDTAAPHEVVLPAPPLDTEFEALYANSRERDSSVGGESIIVAQNLLTSAIDAAVTKAFDDMRNPLYDLAQVLRQSNSVRRPTQQEDANRGAPGTQNTAIVATDLTFLGRHWCRRWVQRVRDGTVPPDARCPHAKCRFYPCANSDASAADLSSGAAHFSKRR